MAKDYYAILGVSKSASADELKKAFRRMAHEHHPDKGGDAAKFKDVNEAYQILGDEKKRAAYDRFGSAAFEQGGGGGAGFDPSGFDFSGFQGGGFNMGDFGDLGDVLGEMFGFNRGGGRGGQPRGQDIQVDVELSFKEMAFGLEKEIHLYKHERCAKCSGDGVEPGSKLHTCKTCQGSGQVKQMQRTIFGSIQTASVCPTCQGRGQVPEKACTSCKGLGVERREKTIRVPIPAGLNEGDALKVPGEGEAAPHGGRPGDLYVRIHVKADPRFTREENDVISEQFIPFSTLVLGGKIQVDTLDGAETVTVEAHTPVGTVLTIRNKGVASSRGHRGHHQVRLVADIPKKLNKEQREAIEKLKQLGL